MRGHNKECGQLSLHLLINKVSLYSSAAARKNSTVIINSVHSGIYINPANKRIIPVITELLEAVVANAKDSEICITAERFREIVILHVQDLHNNNGYALGFSLQSLEKEATDAGAFIQFKDQQRRVATVSLSFSN